MSGIISIKRGYDIKLKGEAAKIITALPVSDVIAVKPADFPLVKPKLLVKPGDTIKAGECLFLDKNRPELNFVSPVSGEIAEIVLGIKRRILEIRILPDKAETRYTPFLLADPATLSRDHLITQLLKSGCWNYLRQRPFHLIANPEDQPKAIFISCFDSAPLAPDLEYLISQEPENFETGLKALQVISNGQLHLSFRHHPDHQQRLSEAAKNITDKIHHIKGPHPAGNVGIQIHHIAPIQKGQMVWYIHPQDVMIIGRLFNEGRYRADRCIAVTGSECTQPRYVSTISGQRMDKVINQEVNAETIRLIQGNVLHGAKSSSEDFLSFYTNQLTLIPEGNEPMFLGWLLPGLKRLSLSRAYLSWMAPKRKYALNTNKNGEERAFVMSGQYDKVLPMDIYPVFLLKAILAKDIEKMEALGIYEVSEEDFALCEFVCTSKIDVQQIVRNGLEMMRKEG